MDDDAVLMAIGRLEGKMDGIGREIGDLKYGIQSCQSNCRDSREKVSKRIRIVEDFRRDILAYAVVISIVITAVVNWVIPKIFGGST